MRSHPIFSIPSLGWLALAAIGVTPCADAALGGDIATVAQDRVHMKATVRTGQATLQSATPLYTVHEMVAPSGTVVREFSGANGKVFAVTWAGPAVPDLRQLLGASFETYAAPGATGPRAHGHRQVARGDLVVHSSGRMRAFSGKAYLASLVPSGVAIDALQ